MAEQLIDAIAWDWGRVLGIFDSKLMWSNLAGYGTLPVEELKKRVVRAMRLHEAGKIASEEFYTRVLRAGVALSYEQFVEAWGSCIIGENPGITDVLRRIKPGIRQCVISNTDPIHWTRIGVLPMMRQFFPNLKTLVRSYDPGVWTLKPGPKIYREVQQRLGIRPSEPDRLLYVDDVIEYCTAGATLGFKTQHYNCVVDPIERIEEALDSLGALQ